MSRLGTCRWAYQIQEMWRGEDLESLKRVADTTDEYTCQWLDQFGQLPPPIRRQHGGFSVRATDCDACPRYTEPSIPKIG